MLKPLNQTIHYRPDDVFTEPVTNPAVTFMPATVSVSLEGVDEARMYGRLGISAWHGRPSQVNLEDVLDAHPGEWIATQATSKEEVRVLSAYGFIGLNDNTLYIGEADCLDAFDPNTGLYMDKNSPAFNENRFSELDLHVQDLYLQNPDIYRAVIAELASEIQDNVRHHLMTLHAVDIDVTVDTDTGSLRLVRKGLTDILSQRQTLCSLKHMVLYEGDVRLINVWLQQSDSNLARLYPKAVDELLECISAEWTRDALSPDNLVTYYQAGLSNITLNNTEEV